MRFLLATAAHNENVQQIVQALQEAGALAAYHTGGVDHYRSAWARRLREGLALLAPAADRNLRRRRMAGIPESRIHPHRRWEAARTLAGRLGLPPRCEDWLWERGEHHLDRFAARALNDEGCEAFLGVEHGCLRALIAARRLGKPGVVAFLSPHHSARRRSIEAEYARWPELLTPEVRRFSELARGRDARRDDEARVADLVYANSRVTARSLIEAGIPEQKIIVVPLGGPAAIPDASLPSALPEPLRFVFAGSISAGKGAHHLLEAWRRLDVGKSGAELHLYGRWLLPRRWRVSALYGVVHQGVVPRQELAAAFRHALVLVLPTLSDGWGSVVSEALANGLPVITTANAGAADLIEDGRNGFMVPPADPEALAERLAWCLHHPSDLLAMRRHAAATAGRWTWVEFREAFRRRLADHLGEPSLAPSGAATALTPEAGRQDRP